jgi:hypothetical protein
MGEIGVLGQTTSNYPRVPKQGVVIGAIKLGRAEMNMISKVRLLTGFTVPGASDREMSCVLARHTSPLKD